MEDNDRLLLLMKEAVAMIRKSQEKRKELQEGKISDAEASHCLKDFENKFDALQQQIGKEMKK